MPFLAATGSAMASHCCPRQVVSNSVTSQASLLSSLNHRRIAPPAARTHLLSLRNQGLGSVSLKGLRVEGKAPEARRWSIRASAAGMGAGAGGEAMGENESPYLILGVSALEKFEVIKAAHGRRRKDAEKRGDDATVERLDKAYDRIMMMQLSNRRKGISFGGVGVSKEIKYADKRSWFPWGPKKAVVEKNDMLINLGIAVLLTAWCAVLGGQTDWKPLQFMIFGYIFRIFTKLGEFDAPAPSSFVSEEEEGEEGGAAPGDTGRRLRNGKRLLRTLGLVFSCVAFASLAYTGTLNAYEYFLQYVPRVLMGAQELFVTGFTAVGLFIMASFYR